MDIQFVKGDKEIKECFSIMKQLVSKLSEKEFIKIAKAKKKYGHNLIKLELDGKLIAVAGIKEYQQFDCGKMLILDELVVDKKHRGKGYGGALFDWIIDYAKKNNCQVIELDSNVKLHKAHKFYMKKGMNISHHHFSIEL